MFRGDTKRFTLTITRSGSAEDLAGAALRWTAKPSLSDTDDAVTTIKKTIGDGITVTDEPGGIALLQLDPADTILLTKTTTYHYDVQLVTAGGDVETIDTGKITVKLEASQTAP
jgi:hypothetical protein